MIQQFDVDLSLKVNKQAFKNFEVKIDKEYLKKCDKIEQDKTFDNKFEESKASTDHLEELIQRMNKNIKMAIRVEVKKLKHKE